MKRVLVVLALLLVPGIALAAAKLTFDNPTVDGGTLSYDGVGGPLVGTDIIFQQVIGVDTPANSGMSLFCWPVNCRSTSPRATTSRKARRSTPFWAGGRSR